LLPLLKTAMYGKAWITNFNRATNMLWVGVQGYDGMVRMSISGSGMVTSHGRHPSQVSHKAHQIVSKFRNEGFPRIPPHGHWPPEVKPDK